MKMKPDDYQHLNKRINEVLAGIGETTESFCKTYAAAGWSQERARWDAFHSTGLRFKYLKDDHIDTALRKIFGHNFNNYPRS